MEVFRRLEDCLLEFGMIEQQMIQTRLVQSVVAAIRRPPVAHEHAGVVGPQHRGGIVESAAGADRVDGRVRGGEYPQPVAFAADAPAGLVRRDHGCVADLLAQLRVGRRGGAGRPVQHLGEAARRDLQPERAGGPPSPAAPPSPCAARRPARRPRDRAARPPRPARWKSAARGGPAPAADTASSGRPRCRSAAPPGAPRAALPDTATPRGSLRPRRRSPDTPPGPAPRGSRRPAPGAGGSRGGHTPHRPAVRGAPRDLAAGPWQTVRPAGDPPGVPRPTVVSGPRPVASGGQPAVAGGCSCVAASWRLARAASPSPGAARLRRPGLQPDAQPLSGPRLSQGQSAPHGLLGRELARPAGTAQEVEQRRVRLAQTCPSFRSPRVNNCVAAKELSWEPEAARRHFGPPRRLSREPKQVGGGDPGGKDRAACGGKVPNGDRIRQALAECGVPATIVDALAHTFQPTLLGQPGQGFRHRGDRNSGEILEPPQALPAVLNPSADPLCNLSGFLWVRSVPAHALYVRAKPRACPVLEQKNLTSMRLAPLCPERPGPRRRGYR